MNAYNIAHYYIIVTDTAFHMPTLSTSEIICTYRVDPLRVNEYYNDLRSSLNQFSEAKVYTLDKIKDVVDDLLYNLSN